MVCRGNVCRSPMAEGFFVSQLKSSHSSVIVSSAGVDALINSPADPKALDVMKQRGIDISHHRGRQLTEELVRKIDLLLVMTQSHLNKVVRQFVTAKGKTFLLGHWQGFEIQDPYAKSYEAFTTAYQQIELTWQDWKTRILPC